MNERNTALSELPDGVTLEDLLIPLRAALSTCHDTDWSLRQFKTHITHALAALQPAAVSAEREACARLCDARGVKFHSESPFAAECHGLAEAIRARGDSAQQATPDLQAVCRYISDVLAGDAPSGEKHIARTIMHLLPLEQAVAARQATPEPVALGPLAKRNIYDAIRGAYDLGYNDARNARTVPGDSAPGYDGRSVEEDHGSALFNILSKRLKPATPEPVEHKCRHCGVTTITHPHFGPDPVQVFAIDVRGVPEEVLHD